MDPYHVLGIALWWIGLSLIMATVLWLIRKFIPQHEAWLTQPAWPTIGRFLRRLVTRRPA